MEEKLRTGEGFVKWLRPAGCALFLGLFVIVTVMLFTVKGIPVEGYSPSQKSEYYETRPEELLAEIEENLLPKVNVTGVECKLSDGLVVITIPAEDFNTVRGSVIHYYDEELFTFVEK